MKSLLAAIFLCALSPQLRAQGPAAGELNSAIGTGDFSGYLKNATAWLNTKVPAQPGEAALGAQLKDAAFLATLFRRHLITKIGPDKLGAFASANPANRAFLTWLLSNTGAMELYLEGSVPIGLAAREADTYSLNTAALEIWKNILQADPEASEGIYLKLAIATSIAPPGSVNIGAGGAATPADPVVRYRYYKTAHQDGELFPSFDHLTVWEYSKILCSGATDADLTWAREMINTFRPDLRNEERVVNSTSLVWRRAAPPEFYPAGYVHFKNVLAGGGKCGPRSSWAVMVCHAFGIPAIGVGQPGHACVAHKTVFPMTEPQPGNAWKVSYGRGWEVSKLGGLTGPDFLAGIEKRSDPAKFSQVEHLRWLASALSDSDRAATVMAVAHKIHDSIVEVKVTSPVAPPAKTETEISTTKPAGPAKAIAGVIRVDAASFARTGGEISWGGQFPHVLVHGSHGGGKQVYFQQQMKSQWADYPIEIPSDGTYQIVMKAACINVDQALEVGIGTNVIATVPIPLSHGLWHETTPVDIKLKKGMQTIRIQTPTVEHKRGIALKWFELKPR